MSDWPDFKAGFSAALAAFLLSGSGVHAQETRAAAPVTLNYFGMPGLIDMPTAFSAPDADLSTTITSFAGQTRGTLSFQITPRLTGSFRYSGLQGVGRGGITPGSDDIYYDRSFDLHYRLIDEGGYWPALAIGLRDFGGTGVYGGEYIVASKHFGANDQFAITAGLGWGRLGSRGGFTNPLHAIDDRFETRPPPDVGMGGTFSTGQWFRGDAAVFGGFEWRPNDRFAFQVEYSSDAYAEEQADGVFSESSPFNFGMTYHLSEGTTLGAHYLYGSELGISLAFTLNPNRPPTRGLNDSGPVPVMPRPVQAEPYSTDWMQQADAPQILHDNVTLLLEAEGIELESLSLGATRARVVIVNQRHDAEAQALGRTARILTATLPHSVESFEIVFLVQGMETSQVTLRRSDLEALEHHPDGSFLIRGRAEVADGATGSDAGMITVDREGSRFEWALAPFFEGRIFDPENPLLFDVGAELSASYEFAPGLVVSGAARATFFGNLDEARLVDIPGPTSPPPVRTDAYLYAQQGRHSIEHLTFEYFDRPAENLYSRVTVGYLEAMYGGISAELLWQPVDSRLGLGAEINYVMQRDYDMLFGFRDYSILTGHASAYYDLGGGFQAQLDVGRYLAGDWGGTFTLDRTFENGWSIGAFATLTDVSFDDFGEGSFDKGIRLTVPFSWFTGRSTRQEQSGVIRPILRDGGARLEVRNRLHDVVTDYHEQSLDDQWGRVWR